MGELYRLDFPNGKSYIGITTKTSAARFIGHKRAADAGRESFVYRAWRKHGAPFLRVLAFVENKILAETEIKAIACFGTLHPDGYNMAQGGQMAPTLSACVVAKLIGKKRSQETKDKIAAKKLGVPVPQFCGKNNVMHRPEVKEKMRGVWLGRKHSKETIEKMRASRLGISRAPHSEETKLKISTSNKGKTKGRLLSEETKLKISKAHKGRVHSAATKHKMSLARKLAWQLKRGIL